MTQNAVVAGGWLADQISLGVLASSVPRDAVDEVVAAAGRAAKRSDGKLPPHVMVYFVMAMALFAEEDDEEVAARLAGPLGSWGCWDGAWQVPTSGGITQARKRLGWEVFRELYAQVAAPVAGLLTRGAFLGPWRLMAIDGFEWDAPDTPENAAAFGYAGLGDHRSAFPKVRVVTVSECASHVMVDAEIGGVAGKGSGEQALARRLYGRLGDDWLLIADRNFYNWADGLEDRCRQWRAAAVAGQGRPVLAGDRDIAGRVLLLRADQPEDPWRGPASTHRGRPRRAGSSPRAGRGGAGHRVHRPRP
jgi:hypothetical protein